MADKASRGRNISFLGEFVDKELEAEFFSYYIGRAIKYIRPVTLSLGILYMLFIIPDYFLIKNHDAFRYILINRLVFLTLIIILFFAIKKIKNYLFLANLITAYEIAAIISFLIIVYQYESPDFLIQAFGVIVIILGIFLIPNKWINMIFASLAITSTFIALSAYCIRGIELSEFSAGIVYIIIVIALSGISSYRIGYYKRKQYMYSKELLRLSYIDPLTEIYNRGKFDEELERWFNYSQRYGVPISLVMFDFDNFKMINDSFGHLVGDQVIIQSVKLIKNAIRQTDVFARWGGEEFVILLANTEKQQAIAHTERLRELIADFRFEKVGCVTCSFGVATIMENDSTETLLNRADKLLYLAKSSGKNRVVG